MTASKLGMTRAFTDTTLGEDLGVADADELYAAMDWLIERQEKIERRLARRHLKSGGLVLFDLTSSYFEGVTCPLAKIGYSRDGKTTSSTPSINRSSGCSRRASMRRLRRWPSRRWHSPSIALGPIILESARGSATLPCSTGRRDGTPMLSRSTGATLPSRRRRSASITSW